MKIANCKMGERQPHPPFSHSNLQFAITCKGNTIYVHVLNWTGDTISLPALPKKIVSSSVLTGGSADVKQAEDQITLSVPAQDRQKIDTIVKLELDGSATDIAPLGASLTTGRPATASNVYSKDPAYGAEKAFDEDSDTRWATDTGTKQAWLEVDLGRPVTFDRAEIDEAFAGRVQSFELQYEDGTAWKPFYKGTTLGENFSATFEPVTAQRVRLNVLDATEGPSIAEFRLFPALHRCN